MNDKAWELLEQLYRDMFSDLTRLAYARLHDTQSAKDLAQDTFVAAQENIEKLMSSPNPKGFIMQTLKNKIQHELRARVRFQILLENLETLSKADKTPSGELLEWLSEILDKDELILLTLVYCDGYNYQEAADKLHISYAACRKRAQRAKDKIRQKSPYGFE